MLVSGISLSAIRDLCETAHREDCEAARSEIRAAFAGWTSMEMIELQLCLVDIAVGRCRPESPIRQAFEREGWRNGKAQGE